MAERRKKQLNQMQLDKRNNARELTVAKSDDMIQQSRYSMTVQEQRCVLFVISKIRPDDSVFQEYTFDIKDFYELCGIEDRSYTRMKRRIKDLADKSWWWKHDGKESLLRWFGTVDLNEGSGTVTLKLHENMMPHLLQLANQVKTKGTFYTQYTLKYVLPMRSQFSPRLYELLKSYQKNNHDWYFKVDELREKLDCKQYPIWSNFKARVLDPAVKEINEYTDLNVMMQPIKEGRAFAYVKFFMDTKSKDELSETSLKVYRALDGQISMEDFSMQLLEPETPEDKFRRENAPKHRKKASDGV